MSTQGYALSPQQKQVMRHQGLLGYAQQTVMISGILDADIVQRTLQLLVERHEILRTTLNGNSTIDLQIQIIGQPDLKFQYHDLTGKYEYLQGDHGEPDMITSIRKRLTSDLDDVMFSLVKLDNDIHYLIVSIKNVFADSVTLDNLVVEFVSIYKKMLADAEVVLDDAIQYVDISEWENEILASSEAKVGIEFWKEKQFWKQSIAILPIPVPLENKKPESDTLGYKTHKCTPVNGSNTQSLRQLCKQTNVDLSTMLFTIWSILLYRLDKSFDNNIGVMFDGRSDDETTSVFGAMEKYLPIASTITDMDTLLQLLERNANTLQDAEVWEECFSWDYAEANTESEEFLFFAYEYREQQAPQSVGETSFCSVNKIANNDRYLVKLKTVAEEDSIEVLFEFDSDHIPQDYVARLAGRFSQLLSSVLEDTGRTVGQLSIVPDDEKERLINDFSNVNNVIVNNRSFIELFQKQVKIAPNSVALEMNGKSLSFNELDIRSDRLACKMLNEGDHDGVVVGVYLERSIDVIVSLIAILKMNNIYLPLDTTYPIDRINYMINDASITTLITTKHCRNVEVDDAVNRLYLDEIDLSKPSENPQGISTINNLCRDANKPAYIIYTSGTTGQPKGVIIPLGALASHCVSVQAEYEINASDRVLLFAPFSFDPSIEQCLPALISGAAVILREDATWDVSSLASRIIDLKLTIVNFPTEYWQLLVSEWSESSDNITLGALRIMIAGGDRMLPDMVDKWLGLKLKNVRLLNAYGPTEATITATTADVNEVTFQHSSVVPIGKPLLNKTAFILDEYGELVPVGCRGELYLGGETLSLGYVNKPEVTQEKFISSGFLGGEEQRLYRTGDIAYFDTQGKLYFDGRTDDQEKVRGYRIEPSEIENVLTKMLGVTQANVIVKQDNDGSSSKMIIAFYVTKSNADISREVHNYLAEVLPEYMMPSHCINIQSLPLMPNGKVDKNALHKIDLNQHRDEDYVQPEGEIEIELASMLSKYLGMSKVNVADSFIQVGGHSLIAMRFSSEIKKKWGSELSLKDIYQCKNIQAIAKLIGNSIQGVESVQPAIEKITGQDKYPLSYSQRRILLLDQMGFGHQYNIPGVVKLSGDIKLDILNKSLDYVVKKHASLRTRFVKYDTEVFQTVDNETDVNIEAYDFSDSPDNSTAIGKTLIDWAGREFNLESSTLLRTIYIKENVDTCYLGVCIHHIVSDAVSMSIVIGDLSAAYSAFDAGSEPCPQPALIDYADYAHWQQNFTNEGKYQRELDYWISNLDDYSNFENNSDFPRPARFSGSADVVNIGLDRKKVCEYRRFCREGGVTFYSLILSAVYFILARQSGQTDLCIGMPIEGRDLSEVDDIVGCFINTLVIRIQQDDFELSPQNLLMNVHEKVVDAQDHQSLPFEVIVKNLDIVREYSRNPIFQVLVNCVQAVDLPEFGDVHAEQFNFGHASAKCDLSFDIVEGRDDNVELTITYSSDLYKHSSIESLARSLLDVLDEMVDLNNEKVSDIPVCSRADRDLILASWSGASSSENIDNTIQPVYTLFEKQVSQTPENIAAVFNGNQITYKELNHRANKLANLLIERGVKQGGFVGIHLGRSLEMLVAIVGVMKVGSAFVPLDPMFPKDRLAYMIDNSGIDIIVTTNALSDNAIFSGKDCIALDSETIRALLEKCANKNIIDANVDLGLKSLAYLIYTSGSTGVPKGVMIDHTALGSFIRGAADYLALDIGTRLLAVTTLSFDISILELLGPLTKGGRVHIAGYEESRDGEKLSSLLRANEINIMQATPSTWKMLVDAHWQGSSNLQILCGGEQMPLNLAKQLVNRGKKLVNCYGPTEATIWSHMSEVKFDEPQINVAGLLPDYKQYVVLPRAESSDKRVIGDRDLAPIGVAGELMLGGGSLSLGYLNDKENTQEKFVDNPFDPCEGSRLYKTGDLVRWLPDGSLEFLGRSDSQVKIRGYRIELAEIEIAIAKVSNNSEVVVLTKNDGVGEQYIVAYMVVHKGPDNLGVLDQSAKDEIVRQIGKILPSYMIPNAFVSVDKLPVTPNGKIDRNQLKDLDTDFSNEKEYIAPKCDDEVALCRLWESVLDKKQIGITDNFFELGGHSLLASKLVSRVREIYGSEIPLRYLFEAPTVEKLLTMIKENRHSELLPPIVPVSRDSDLAVSFSQKRLLFIDQLGKGSSQYNMPAGFRLKGKFCLDAFKNAMSKIIERHEVIRTTFVMNEGTMHQVINHDVDPLITFDDLTSTDIPVTDSHINDHDSSLQISIQEEIDKPFDLEKDVLLRAKVIKLSDSDHAAILTMHHVASDGWTINIIIQEFNRLYNALSNGESLMLAPLNVQYADYAAWQGTWLSGELLQNGMDFWSNRLASIPAVHSLPLDKVRPLQQTYSGSVFEFSIDQKQTQAINTFCAEHDATLFMFLHSVFALLLSKYSNESDIVVGVPIAGRNHKDLEGLAGFFANTLVLRSDFSEEQSFIEHFNDSKKVIIDAYSHQHIPFEMLVEHLNPERSLSYGPLFQILMVLQDGVQDNVNLDDITTTKIDIKNTSIKSDMEFSVLPENGGLSISWYYNTDLFVGETIKTMSRSFCTLLSGILNNPLKSIERYSLLDQAQLDSYIDERSARLNDASFLDMSTLPQLFETLAEKSPEAIAVSCNSETITYGELNKRSNQLAHYLINDGIQHEEIVGLLVDRSIEMTVGILGILKAGGAYLPMDPMFPSGRLQHMLTDSGTERILALTQYSSLLEGLDSNAITYIDEKKVRDEVSQGYVDSTEVNIELSNLMYIIYTSGSTGNPKGVLVEHGNAARLFKATEDEFGFNPSDIWTMFHSFSFDFSVWEFWGALAYGGKLVLVDKETGRDPVRFSKLLVDENVTVLSQIPTSFYALSKAIVEKEISHSLTHVIFGGEALDYSQLKLWYSVAENHKTTLVNMYGITETTVHVTYRKISSSDLDTWTSDIGLPIKDLTVAICDKNLQIVPSGVVGELLVGGAGVARGYLNQQDLTHKKFVRDPFMEGSELTYYRTGDLVRESENGHLVYMGRIDHQEKIRGFRIELGEIEYHLTNVEGVEEAVVLAVQDDAGNKQLTAHVVYKGDTESAETTEDSKEKKITFINSYLKVNVPDYMIPTAYQFLDKLPLTPSGKVDRKLLPGIGNSYVQRKAFVAPCNEIESKLAKIWQENLKVDNVGVRDNYFSLGGDSIRALGVIASAKAAKIEISVADLFNFPTVAELSAVAEKREQESNTELYNLLNEIENLSDEDVLSQLELEE